MSTQPHAVSREGGQLQYQAEYINPQALVQDANIPPCSGSTTGSAHLDMTGPQCTTDPFHSSAASSNVCEAELNGRSFMQPSTTLTSFIQESPLLQHTSHTPSPTEDEDIMMFPIHYEPGKLYENHGSSSEPVTPFSIPQPSHPPNSNPEHPLTSAALGARNRAFHVQRKHPTAVRLLQYWDQHLRRSDFVDEHELQALAVLTKLSHQDILSWFDAPADQRSKLDEPIQSISAYRCMNPTYEENRDADQKKTFLCFDPYCHRRFNKKDDLKKHMEIENPSQEWFCGSQGCRPYGRKDKFRDHVRQKHKGDLDIEDLDKYCEPNTSQKFPQNCPSCSSACLSSFKDWFNHWTDYHCPRDPTGTIVQLPRRSDSTPSLSRVSSCRQETRSPRVSRTPVSDNSHHMQQPPEKVSFHRFVSEPDMAQNFLTHTTASPRMDNPNYPIPPRDPVSNDIDQLMVPKT